MIDNGFTVRVPRFVDKVTILSFQSSIVHLRKRIERDIIETTERE